MKARKAEEESLTKCMRHECRKGRRVERGRKVMERDKRRQIVKTGRRQDTADRKIGGEYKIASLVWTELMLSVY